MIDANYSSDKNSKSQTATPDRNQKGNRMENVNYKWHASVKSYCNNMYSSIEKKGYVIFVGRELNNKKIAATGDALRDECLGILNNAGHASFSGNRIDCYHLNKDSEQIDKSQNDSIYMNAPFNLFAFKLLESTISKDDLAQPDLKKNFVSRVLSTKFCPALFCDTFPIGELTGGANEITQRAQSRLRTSHHENIVSTLQEIGGEISAVIICEQSTKFARMESGELADLFRRNFPAATVVEGFPFLSTQATGVSFQTFVNALRSQTELRESMIKCMRNWNA